MKIVNLAIKVKVPDGVDDKDVARIVDKVLEQDCPCGQITPAGWKVGKTVITRPRVDRAKGR